ncbi:MAG TPA: CPBP family intramembrane glutamic endopeptidase [Stellaceae bacterium]|nr:CPBP family intramembrane glutamic endopeptidase [Stellaceae bacterium]
MAGHALSNAARPRGRQFIDLALRGSNTPRSYGATLLRIILYPLAVALLLGLAALIATIVSHRPPGSIDPIVGVVVQYGLIVVAGFAVLRGVERSHLRPWRSVVAADLSLDWRRLAIGGAVQLAILAGELALVHALFGWPWRMSLAVGLPLFVLAMCLIPLQSASEEILFRGYLTQSLGRIVRSRVLIAAAVALVFGALHLNSRGSLTVPYFFVLSLVFSLVSLRDEGLELAIGGHAGINMFAFGAANLTLVGPGVVGGGDAAMPFNAAAILAVAVNGAIFYGGTRLLVRVFCKPRSPI